MFLIITSAYADEQSTLLHKGKEYLRSALYEQAIQIFEKGLLNSNGEKACLFIEALVEANYANQNYAEVVRLFNQHPHLDSSSKAFYFYGLSLLNLENYLEAFQIFSTIWETHHHREALLQKGISLFWLKKDQEAKELLTQYLSLSDQNTLNDFEAHLFLIRLDLQNKLFLEAEKKLNKLHQDKGDCFEYFYLKGEEYFQKNDLEKACIFFEKSYENFSLSYLSWKKHLLRYLGQIHFKLSQPNDYDHHQKSLFYYQKLVQDWPEESTSIEYAECLIHFGDIYDHPASFKEADQFLANLHFDDKTYRAQSLLLRAKTAESFLAKDRYYRQILQENSDSPPIQAKAWLMKGISEYQYARSDSQRFLSDHLFENAISSLEKAYELYHTFDLQTACDVLMQLTEIYALIPPKGELKAAQFLEDFLKKDFSQIAQLQEPDKIYYYLGYYLIQAAHKDDDPSEALLATAEKTLLDGLEQYPNGDYTSKSLELLGLTYLKRQNWEMAAKYFEKILEKDVDDVSSHPEALFWLSESYETLNPLKAMSLRQEFLEKYPTHPLCAEIYFKTYTPFEYLQGSKQAIKHLKDLPFRYPNSPFSLNALYFIGLDLKRNRQTPEGRWLTRKNLIASIDTFQQLVNLHDSLTEKNFIATSQQEYYAHLAFKAHLEKANCNLAIAHESEGTKKQIYLEYAEQTFAQIYENLQNKQQAYSKSLGNLENYLSLSSECLLGWSDTLTLLNQFERAEGLLRMIIANFQEAKTTRSYFLAQAWSKLGKIFFIKNNFPSALASFKQAQECSKGKLLNTDDRLELRIWQSQCHEAQGQLDQAILTLSKVINDDAISSLRLKAMYLRAEIYKKQHRYELARKQFEALAKKSGEWALKAQEALKNHD